VHVNLSASLIVNWLGNMHANEHLHGNANTMVSVYEDEIVEMLFSRGLCFNEFGIKW
jgi:hypothetical protein